MESFVYAASLTHKFMSNNVSLFHSRLQRILPYYLIKAFQLVLIVRARIKLGDARYKTVGFTCHKNLEILCLKTFMVQLSKTPYHETQVHVQIWATDCSAGDSKDSIILQN